MIKSLSTSGHTTYGIKEFVLDTIADLVDLPVDATMGSTAFIIATGAVYMLNSAGEWVEV